jgi:hypothetical protein
VTTTSRREIFLADFHLSGVFHQLLFLSLENAALIGIRLASEKTLSSHQRD